MSSLIDVPAIRSLIERMECDLPLQFIDVGHLTEQQAYTVSIIYGTSKTAPPCFFSFQDTPLKIQEGLARIHQAGCK